jgi:CSLREA domain-containing protein
MKFLLALCCAAAASASVRAATITVTGLNDTLNNNGVCTIREAIINANNNAATWADCAAGSGSDVINLPSGTIALSIPNTPNSFNADEVSLRGDLDITSSMTINGSAAGTTINGAALDRIFDINPDTDGLGETPTPSITVHIHTLTITNGRQNDVGAVRVLTNATVTIRDCTVSNSVSWANDTGGVYNAGTLTMVNSTVTGNSALLLAGGIRNDGTMTLSSCTVTNNRTTGGTPTRGQGVTAFGTVVLRNTIVAANVAGRPDIEGSFESHGYNIIGSIFDGVGNIATITPNPGTADQIGVNAALINLGSLQNNGGPTKTHALGAGSIAIDKGKSFALATDQRGKKRPCDNPAIANAPGGDGSDIGSFEVENCSPPDECCCRRVGRRLVGPCCPSKPIRPAPSRRL